MRGSTATKFLSTYCCPGCKTLQPKLDLFVQVHAKVYTDERIKQGAQQEQIVTRSAQCTQCGVIINKGRLFDALHALMDTHYAELL